MVPASTQVLKVLQDAVCRLVSAVPHLDSTLNTSGQQDLRCNYSAAVFNPYSNNHRFDEVTYLLFGSCRKR